jgi:hypothetical protein
MGLANCDWESERMQAFYSWLDAMKARNVDIALNVGWWLSDSYFRGVPTTQYDPDDDLIDADWPESTFDQLNEKDRGDILKGCENTECAKEKCQAGVDLAECLRQNCLGKCWGDSKIKSWIEKRQLICRIAGKRSSIDFSATDADQYYQGLLDEFAGWVSASVHQLVTVKGYTNVKYLMLLTEPTQSWELGYPCSSKYFDLGPWPWYREAVRRVHERLARDGRRTLVKLVGPNNATDVIDVFGERAGEDGGMKEEGRFLFAVTPSEPHATTIADWGELGVNPCQRYGGLASGVYFARQKRWVTVDVGYEHAYTDTAPALPQLTVRHSRGAPASLDVIQPTRLDGFTARVWVYRDIFTLAGQRVCDWTFTPQDVVFSYFYNGYDWREWETHPDYGLRDLNYAVRDLGDVLDVYSAHSYGTDKYLLDYSDWNALCREIVSVVGDAKPVWLDEWGSDMNLRSRSEYGTYMAEVVSACANAGVQTSLHWMLFDQKYVYPRDHHYTGPGGDFVNGVQKLGSCFWPHDASVSAESRTSCRPSWLAFSLLSKYMGGDGGTRVYAVASDGNVYGSAIQDALGNWSFLIINTNPVATSVQVALTSELQRPLYRHLYDPAVVGAASEADVYVIDGVVAEPGTGFMMTLPANAFAVYTTRAHSPSPTLISPPDGASATAPVLTQVNARTPFFIWDAHAPGYELEVDDDPGFSNPLIRANASWSTYNADPTMFGAIPAVTYYWRVRAVYSDGSTGAWSDVWRFTILSQEPVDQPTWAGTFQVSYMWAAMHGGGPDGPGYPDNGTSGQTYCGKATAPWGIDALPPGTYRARLVPGASAGWVNGACSTPGLPETKTVDDYWWLVSQNNPLAVKPGTGFRGGLLDAHPGNPSPGWFSMSEIWVGPSPTQGVRYHIEQLGDLAQAEKVFQIGQGETAWFYIHDWYVADNLGGATVELWRINTPQPGLILDRFDRADGPLGSPWFGPEGLGGYRISAKKVDVSGGGPIYWAGPDYGVEQQATVKLTAIDQRQVEHGLLLKVQGEPPDWRDGYICVTYVGARQQVKVSAYRPSEGKWTDYAPFGADMKDGDRFAAKVLSNGRVRVFQNGKLIGVVRLNAKDARFYNAVGGRIGLWFSAGGAEMEAWLDNFGGGALPVAAAAQGVGEDALPAGESEDGVPVIEAYTERARDTSRWPKTHLPTVGAN